MIIVAAGAVYAARVNYTKNLELELKPSNVTYGELDYKYSRVFSSAAIESDLKSGLLPLINVRYKGNGVTRWLIVAGAAHGEFLVFA